MVIYRYLKGNARGSVGMGLLRKMDKRQQAARGQQQDPQSLDPGRQTPVGQEPPPAPVEPQGEAVQPAHHPCAERCPEP
ncbi:hypothetical protein EYF80_026096 [Liparis tanakae]|uniref:Uncharacterized protein n=1 Tax=Liparis tanakae TaxID=230148 RepID=A0A4Z2HCT6_9TELE|nr:hypothetical protein EYF80_026096 [Liparis tanakae]